MTTAELRIIEVGHMVCAEQQEDAAQTIKSAATICRFCNSELGRR